MVYYYYLWSHSSGIEMRIVGGIFFFFENEKARTIAFKIFNLYD